MRTEVSACTVEELPELVALTNRVFRAAGEEDMGVQYPLLFSPEYVEHLRVVRQGGKIVTHVGVSMKDAAILGCSFRVASIGAVCSDPDARGAGFASAAMEDARRHAREHRASVMLISGGRGLYHRLGYVQVGQFSVYEAPAGESRVTVERHASEELPAVETLHQREPIRFFRSRRDWDVLLRAGTLMNRKSDLLTVRVDGEIVAYAGVQRPVTDKEGKLGPARAFEIGGDPEALAEALPAVAARYGAPAAVAVAHPSDMAFRRAARARRWSAQSISFPGTLGIIDPGRFLAAIAPLIQEASSVGLEVLPAGDGAQLRVGSEETMLETMGQLTALVFGGDTEEARAVPPLPPAIQAAVGEVFPLPLLWYGYNYV